MSRPAARPAATAAPPPHGRRNRRVALAVVAVVLAGAGGWRLLRPTPASDPPMPAAIDDPEVRRAVEAARAGVLAAPRSADGWGRLGEVFLANLFDTEADLCLAEAARLDPAAPAWPYLRGLIALKRDPANAVALLRQAVAAPGRADAVRPPADLTLAEALLERQQLDEAERLFAAERTRDPSDARPALGRAMVAQARGDEGTAGRLFEAVRRNPSARRTATAALAALARDRGDESAAAALAAEAAALPADAAWPDPVAARVQAHRVGRRARLQQAIELEQEERFAEAVTAFRRVLADGATAQAYVGVGRNLARLGRFDDSLPYLEKAVQTDPDDADARYNLALILFTRAEIAWQTEPGADRLKEALRAALGHARRAAELKPDHARAHLFWGLCHKMLGDPAAAVEPLSKGVACRPEDFELQLALGQVLLDTGNRRDAETRLRNAQRLDPKDPRPAQALAKLSGS